MKVSEAISMLQRHDPNETLCISWWTQDLFTDDDFEITKENWELAVAEYEAEEGYRFANEIIWNNISDLITEKHYEETK